MCIIQQPTVTVTTESRRCISGNFKDCLLLVPVCVYGIFSSLICCVSVMKVLNYFMVTTPIFCRSLNRNYNLCVYINTHYL